MTIIGVVIVLLANALFLAFFLWLASRRTVRLVEQALDRDHQRDER